MCISVQVYYGIIFICRYSQNFLGSWGRNFVGSVIRIILINITQMIVYRWLELPTKAKNIGPPQKMMTPQYFKF